MADNKERSRADELFALLNEINGEDLPEESKPLNEILESDTPASEIPEDSASAETDIGSQVDEILNILSGSAEEAAAEEAKSSENEDPAVNDIPDSIYDHLSDASAGTEGFNEDTVSETTNSHFSDGSDITDPDIAADTDGEPAPGDELIQLEDEPVSAFRKITRAIAGTSFLPKALVYVLLVVIVSAYLAFYIISIANDVFALVTDSKEIQVDLTTLPNTHNAIYSVLEENDLTQYQFMQDMYKEYTEKYPAISHEDVAELLQEKGIIEYAWVYELYMKYRGEEDGADYIFDETHTLNTDMNYTQIIYDLTHYTVTSEVVRVTIPEGYTVDQIIDLLVRKGIGQREDYIEVINNYPYKWEFVRQLDEMGYSEDRKYRLEGYLYPDTYDFNTNEDEIYIINKILDAFNDRFWSDFVKEDENGITLQMTMQEKYGMTFDDIVVLASVVQSEGGTISDFYHIADVFHNRLDNPAEYPRLESDATIQYVLPERVSSSELDTSYDTPYNTYLYDGLPPGAISNPGLEALSAAMFPVAPKDPETEEPMENAYYFVANNAGKTYYARTIEEHEANKEQAKKDNAAMNDGTYIDNEDEEYEG